MRKYRIIIMTAVAAIATALFSACSADEPEITPKTIDPENPLQPVEEYESRSFAEMLNTSSELILSRTDIKSYRKDDWTNGGWEEYDFREYVGGGVPAPHFISVKDGKLYTELKGWSCAEGPSYFSTALGLLMKVRAIHRDSEVLVSRDFSLEENVIKVCGIDLSVKDIKGDKMWLATVLDYYGGRTHNGGQELYIVTYDANGGDKPNGYYFDKVEDAYAWVIEKFRARFGEEVNRNYYTGGMIIYDQPMFSVAMLEYELQRYLAGDLVL